MKSVVHEKVQTILSKYDDDVQRLIVECLQLTTRTDAETIASKLASSWKLNSKEQKA